MKKYNFIAQPGRQEVVLTYTFDAPCEIVFKLFSDPLLIPSWWGPRRFSTVVDKMDFTKGGVWRFVQYDNAGNEYAFNGIYHEILPPVRIINTFEYEGVPGRTTLAINTFEEKDGKTLLTEKTIFQSVEDRDGMLHWDMEGGAIETLERLEELINLIKKGEK